MGGGDIKLMAWIGPFLGPAGTLVSLFFAAMIAAPCGLIMIILGKGRREGGFTKFAFGPYLCMGSGLVLYFGSERMAMAYMEFNERMILVLEPILRPLVEHLL
jgi:prepilin signal peptidase PulO-like enzyme (type II secretory pathway)